MQLLSNADMTRLCWGEPDGPNISVGSLHEFGAPPIRTAHEAVNLLASTTMIWDWQQLRGQGFANGITASGAYIISFRCSKPERALAELREIELAEGGLPYKLVLPIVATIKTRARESFTAHNYHYFVSDGKLSHPEPALSQTAIRVEAELLLTEILNTPEDVSGINMNLLPDSAINRGLVWQAACARLWEPELLRRLGAGDPALYLPRSIFLQCMAVTHIRTTQPSSILVAGQQLRVSADADHTGTWWQLIEFAAGAIPQEALRYLCDLRLPTGLPNLPLARPPAALTGRAASDLSAWLRYTDYAYSWLPVGDWRALGYSWSDEGRNCHQESVPCYTPEFCKSRLLVPLRMPIGCAVVSCATWWMSSVRHRRYAPGLVTRWFSRTTWS